jgi:hypothetical protein
MAKVKEGDRVRIVDREVTDEDRLARQYYRHMAGLTGVVANHYGKDEVAVQVDIESLDDVPQDVHKKATERMREKFSENISDEAKKLLTKEELNFDAHYVVLVREVDIEKV